MYMKQHQQYTFALLRLVLTVGYYSGLLTVNTTHILFTAFLL